MSTHLSIAAGVCALSAVLLIGGTGGAIATADPDANGSTTHSEVADAPVPESSSSGGPIGSVADSLQKRVQQAVQAASALIQRPHGERTSTRSVAPKTTSSATVTATDSATDSDTSSGDSTVAPTPEVEVATADASSSASDTPATTQNEAAPDAVAPAPAVVATAPTVLDAAAAAPTVVSPAPAAAEPLSNPAAPLSGVLTSVRVLLVESVDAIAHLTRLPSELSSALLTIAGVVPVTTEGVGVVANRGAVGADHQTLADDSPTFPNLLFRVGGRPAPATAAGPAVLDDLAPTAPAWSASSYVTPLPLPPPDGPTGSTRSTMQYVVGAVVASASLLALIAMAGPGIGGILITYAAGIRIGYRQVKSRMVMRTSAAARFARSGPIGVVRTGSMISLRPAPLPEPGPPERAAYPQAC